MLMNLSCATQKDGATQFDPQHYEYFPSPVPRAGYALTTLQRPNTLLRSCTLWVWSYENFIACETVIDSVPLTF
jgi:hypothetical protein